MAEKVITMVLKVDLECPRCYKKIKKVLCKFPQIQDQVYDEKKNTVIITVACCSPEKIREKLWCKGGKTIKSIEIKEPPPKPKAEEEKPKSNGKAKKTEDKASPPPPPPPAMAPLPVVLGYSPAFYAAGPCYGWGPCYGKSVAAYYGNCGCGCGRNRSFCYVTPCDYYCEENPSGCSIM